MSGCESCVVAIVQARMGSSRLPRKVLLPLCGHPIVEWVYRRVSKSKKIDKIIFAIPDQLQDDELYLLLKQIGADVYRGDEANVVGRFYQAAKACHATHVVRVCADNPLVDPISLDHLVDFYFANPCDYAYNHIPKGNRYPDGLGAEIASFGILKTIHQKAVLPVQREHLFNYIWDHQKDYVIKTFDPPDDFLAQPFLKLDIDNLVDYERLSSKPLRIEMTAQEIVTIFSGETDENETQRNF